MPVSATPIRALIGRLRRRLAGERGFTLVTVMGLMLVSSAFAAAAFAAANNDIPLSQKDLDGKRAYAAAEAGLNFYLFLLNQDNSYWTKCATAPAQPVNQAWNGQGSDPRTWRTLPDSNAKYEVELLPQNGATQCNTASVAQTMIDAKGGWMQVRATGSSNGVKRSLVATLKRAGFLDFLYFTNWETLDPIVYGSNQPGNCAQPRASRPPGCVNIQFANQDVVAGPMHTNDTFLACGDPVFGRAANGDSIEAAGPAPGWQEPNGCSGSPVFSKPIVPNAPNLPVPTSNSSLLTVAQSGGLTFNGTTTIVLSGSTATVTNNNVTKSYDLTATNGVIYVNTSGTCGAAYGLQEQYNEPSGCAKVYVSGSYSQSLTIGSADDIVVNGNLTRAAGADSTLGLIPTNFVRIYHPVTFNDDKSNCSNASSGPYGSAPPSSGVQVDAAILSLTHSFIVDNYWCGQSLGTLTVNGAIAQNFRGPVGTSGGTGYIKSYNYDDRLRVENPPYFLDPLQSAWRIGRYNEQLPPR